MKMKKILSMVLVAATLISMTSAFAIEKGDARAVMGLTLQPNKRLLFTKHLESTREALPSLLLQTMRRENTSTVLLMSPLSEQSRFLVYI